jgi:inactivated superfamily I helicase
MTDSDAPPPDAARQNGFEAYAKFCLDLAAEVPDRRRRLVLREMAAAWLNLADGTLTVFAADPLDVKAPSDGQSPS